MDAKFTLPITEKCNISQILDVLGISSTIRSDFFSIYRKCHCLLTRTQKPRWVRVVYQFRGMQPLSQAQSYLLKRVFQSVRAQERSLFRTKVCCKFVYQLVQSLRLHQGSQRIYCLHHTLEERLELPQT